MGSRGQPGLQGRGQAGGHDLQLPAPVRSGRENRTLPRSEKAPGQEVFPTGAPAREQSPSSGAEPQLGSGAQRPARGWARGAAVAEAGSPGLGTSVVSAASSCHIDHPVLKTY